VTKSVLEVDAALTAPGAFFEIEELDIRGVRTRTWKNAPRSLREVVNNARANGDRDYIILDEEHVTYEQHFRRVATLAHALINDFGVRKGDRVAIAMRNYLEWSYAFYASVVVGAVAVPLNAMWTGTELLFGITDCGAKVLIVDGERLERLTDLIGDVADLQVVSCHLEDRKTTQPLPPSIPLADVLANEKTDLPDVDIEPEDNCTLFYTSGTTGFPKGVLGTHRNICSNLWAMMFVGFRMMTRFPPPADAPSPSPTVLLQPVPLFHATGCHSSLVGQMFFGGTLVFMRKWDPEVALDLIEKERITSVAGVPAMVWDLINSPTLDKRDLSSLKSLGGGGAAAPPELQRRVVQRLPQRGLGTGYGLTETSSLVTSIGGPDYAERPSSVGVPIPVCDVILVDDDGKQVAEGERGEIWIKGPNVVPGYWDRPEETAKTFTDGFLHTGDIGVYDDERYLYIVDRAKDLIIRGGENISSAEVEAALYEHPAVFEAAAIAVPHQTLGEEVGAVVVLAEGASVTAEDLRAHCLERIGAFKVPVHVWFLPEPLPRGATGKVLKNEIRERFNEKTPA
jgi:long-chain acyl-CoA synthetase